MDADACNKFATNVRESACGLYPYLSSGISSAIAINLRPISFQDSNAACEGLGAGLGGAFFAASCCASTGSAMKDAAIAIPAIHNSFFIPSSVALLLHSAFGARSMASDALQSKKCSAG